MRLRGVKERGTTPKRCPSFICRSGDRGTASAGELGLPQSTGARLVRGAIVSLLAILSILTPSLAAQSSGPGGHPIPLCQTGCGGSAGLEVTPDNNELTLGDSLSQQQIDYTITNTGSASASFSVSCSSTGSVTCVR